VEGSPNLFEVCNEPQELIGTNVTIVDFEPLNVPPPKGVEFDVRTNDFAAVNAYYNLQL
jgi:hypothetical protein